MRHGSLFTGIGGFDLAAEWMGWENVFHCEWNEFVQKILKYYWPNAISYGDITKTDFTIHRGQIDILTGGFPCQPYSLAGKRKGKADERHLWPEMLRAIREIQPGWVVGENVPGIINWSGGLVFHEVQTDLEAQGYEIFPVILPACGVNSPHKRERIWFVAYNNKWGGQKHGLCTGRSLPKRTVITNSQGTGNNGIGQLSDYKREGNKTENRQRFWNQSDHNGKIQFTTNSGNQGLQRSKDGRVFGSIRKGKKQQSDRSFCTTWEVFPTQSPLCSRDDGLSSKLDGITFPKWRNESIKAYGNAIVPQVVYQIFKAIEEFNKQPF